MALTEAQILASLQCLGLPVRTDATFALGGDSDALRDAEICRYALERITSDQEVIVLEILEQYALVKFDTDLIDSGGLKSSPMRQKRILRKMMADAIGYAAGGGSSGCVIGRG